ncbi:MAG TPA: vanadium-dependent haloperoxidase [Verrucomicrobiae bacterium]|jgi:hypothetical protein|nr:vanadium-dependent haloperoxidase [Verrucomicrobiae bacterium]
MQFSSAFSAFLIGVILGAALQAAPQPTHVPSAQLRLALHANAQNPQSVARTWDEAILSAIRIDLPNPPVHARNLFHFSAAMYDAWAAYNPVAHGHIYTNKHSAPDIATARREAVSYAAYRILKERYALSRAAAISLPAFDTVLTKLGYDTNNATMDPSTPAGVGNRVAAAVSASFIHDGSYQDRVFQDLPLGQGGYAPFNPPLITARGGITLWNINLWQPLSISDALSQNGIPLASLQQFVGSQWGNVRPFSLTRATNAVLWIDPGPPPTLGGTNDAVYKDQVVTMVRMSSELTPDDGVTLDISPGVFGNNTLGTNDHKGYSTNPVTGVPYQSHVVKRGDFGRVLAEFWADGPSSETPPGHWNVIANSVADNPALVKRIGGTGQVVDDLEWDIKVYFAVNAAVHDAACAAWTTKRYYNGWRPISAVRMMGQRGQADDPNGLLYHPGGFNEVPGLIEIVTPETAKPGGRHAGMIPGFVAIYAWGGPPADPTNSYTGAKWIDPTGWLPYQKKTFVTPSFPGYISGHSTFSRAAAEVLAGITGTPFFPGGLGTFTGRANSFLTFEQGPSQDVVLQWATYFDASDQSGISRIFGGIHPPVDDFAGRKVGSQCGKQTWALAQKYFNGTL